MKNTILELSRIISPPGREDGVRDYVKNKVAGADTVTDAMGSLIVRLPKNAEGEGARIMISASMDEPVFVVNDADGEGRLRFAMLGKIDLSTVSYASAEFEGGAKGVILPLDKDKKDDVLSYCADIGVSSKEAAFSAAGTGVCLRPASSADPLEDKLISAPSAAAKVGVAVLLGVYEKLKNAARGNDIFLAFTAHGKVGARGAGPAAAQITPDRAVSVGAVSAGEGTSRKTGEGPVILALGERFVPDPDVTDALKRSAEAAGVGYSVAVDKKSGVTDASAIQRTGAGTPSGAICVPAKYVGSPAETVDPSDAEGAAEIIAKFCLD